MADEPHLPIKLEEMITHVELLERYPWLTAQAINRWRRERGLRHFKGGKGAIVYAQSDIELALTTEMNASISGEGSEKPPEMDPSPGARPEMSEEDRVRERLFLDELASRRRPRKKPSK